MYTGATAADAIPLNSSEDDYSVSELTSSGEDEEEHDGGVEEIKKGYGRRWDRSRTGRVTMKATLQDKPSSHSQSSRPADTFPETEEAGVLDRIRSILARGLHPNTPEPEAIQSMRLAEKMLRKHNLSRADVDAGAPGSLTGACFTVELVNTASGLPCRRKAWFIDVATAVKYHFGCNYFFRMCRGSCVFRFFGISTNSYAAAMAFEIAFNRICVMASLHTVPVGEYEAKRMTGEISCGRSTYTTGARESYCMGIARGLKTAARTQAPNKSEEDECERKLVSAQKRIADEVLSQLHVKIIAAKKRKRADVRRDASFEMGKIDAEEIDMDAGAIRC